LRVPSVAEPQKPSEDGLGLDTDHARTQTPEASRSITRMGSNIKHQTIFSNKGLIKCAKRLLMRTIKAINPQGTQ
jgi:hypothetical protein